MDYDGSLVSVPLGTMEYDLSGPDSQYVPVYDPTRIEQLHVVVESNQGNTAGTCIYKVLALGS